MPERSIAAREYEPLAAGQVEQDLDVDVLPVHSDHLRDRSRTTGVDFECKQSSARERRRRPLDELARHRQTVIRAEERYARLPIADIGR